MHVVSENALSGVSRRKPDVFFCPAEHRIPTPESKTRRSYDFDTLSASIFWLQNARTRWCWDLYFDYSGISVKDKEHKSLYVHAIFLWTGCNIVRPQMLVNDWSSSISPNSRQWGFHCPVNRFPRCKKKSNEKYCTQLKRKHENPVAMRIFWGYGLLKLTSVNQIFSSRSQSSYYKTTRHWQSKCCSRFCNW